MANGEAYGFFYYKGSTPEISAALPEVRRLTQAPQEMTLDLIEGVDNVKTEDPSLENFVQLAKGKHLSHVLRATAPDMGSRTVASHLGDILSGINLALYDPSEPFCADIVYRHGNRYVWKQK